MESPNQSLGPIKKLNAVLHSEVGLAFCSDYGHLGDDNHEFATGPARYIFHQTVLGVGIVIVKPFLLWVNDGLMAIFFFLIGLEIKHELMVGHLSDIRQALLPLGAAVEEWRHQH